MQTINLNFLFVQLFPAYGFILKSQPEGQNIGKQDFIKLVCETVDVMDPRNNLFLHSIKDSIFETVKHVGGNAIFNEE